MKTLIAITLYSLFLITEVKGQNDSVIRIRPHFLNDIEIGKRPKIRQIQKLGNYTVEKRRNLMEYIPWKFKIFHVGEDIEIGCIRRYAHSIFYEIDDIFVKYPAKAITKEGIILGESNKNDIIRTYGKPDTQTFNALYYYKSEYNHYTLISFIYGDTTLSNAHSFAPGVPVKEKKLHNKIIGIRIY